MDKLEYLERKMETAADGVNLIFPQRACSRKPNKQVSSDGAGYALALSSVHMTKVSIFSLSIASMYVRGILLHVQFQKQLQELEDFVMATLKNKSLRNKIGGGALKRCTKCFRTTVGEGIRCTSGSWSGLSGPGPKTSQARGSSAGE